ncbi:MAG: iron-sulfur cluster carrier protein [Candidatus Binatia bacterium]|nr:MAG: iron-sulfur cluster carrier protein [Candidatus Binatia bacterium]
MVAPDMVTPQQVLEELKRVKYPGLGRDVVSFGFVRDIEVSSFGVKVVLAPTTRDAAIVAQLKEAVSQIVSALPGVREVEVAITQPAPPPQRRTMQTTPLPGVEHVVAVASGKGGVGKSTVAVHLAFALSALGRSVGLLDADIYGPSIPQMVGTFGSPGVTTSGRILPLEAHGVKTISLGHLIDPGTPVIWRGPMITKVLTQFFRDVEWGRLDILVLDLPPGTGDAQLTIAQQIAVSGGLIVTTPQEMALEDVRRGVAMFRELRAPVLGVIENMSFHLCRHCGGRSEPFGYGGGERMAEELGVPFLGRLPLDAELMEACEVGAPLVLSNPEHAVSRAFQELAERVWSALAARGRVALPQIS